MSTPSSRAATERSLSSDPGGGARPPHGGRDPQAVPGLGRGAPAPGHHPRPSWLRACPASGASPWRCLETGSRKSEAGPSVCPSGWWRVGRRGRTPSPRPSRRSPEEPDAPVMIHDGVRPFPPAEPIREALRALAGLRWRAAGGGLHRHLEAGGCRGRRPAHRAPGSHLPGPDAPDRPAVHLAEGLRAARRSGFLGTDDVSLLETLGLRVKVVLAPASNLKLTTPEDWKRAPV